MPLFFLILTSESFLMVKEKFDTFSGKADKLASQNCIFSTRFCSQHLNCAWQK